MLQLALKSIEMADNAFFIDLKKGFMAFLNKNIVKKILKFEYFVLILHSQRATRNGEYQKLLHHSPY